LSSLSDSAKQLYCPGDAVGRFGGWQSGYTVLYVTGYYLYGYPIQGRPGGDNLRQYIIARAASLDHTCYTPHLTLYPSQTALDITCQLIAGDYRIFVCYGNRFISVHSCSIS
jgi:hypothetical protein